MCPAAACLCSSAATKVSAWSAARSARPTSTGASRIDFELNRKIPRRGIFSFLRSALALLGGRWYNNLSEENKEDFLYEIRYRRLNACFISQYSSINLNKTHISELFRYINPCIYIYFHGELVRNWCGVWESTFGKRGSSRQIKINL